MLHEKTAEFTETGSSKPVKRVRFSDEVQNVFEFDGFDENDGSISMENKSNTASGESKILEQVELFTEELSDIRNDDNITITDAANKPFSDNVNEVNELPNCYEGIDESDSLYKEVCFQNVQGFVNNAVKCSLPTFDSVPDTNSLNELITNTKVMTISPTETTLSENLLISPTELSLHESSSETALEKSILQIPEPPFDQKIMTVLSHKRSLEEIQIERQTSKLNSCLRKDNPEVKSADELKTAVFNAWYKVKNEKSVLTVPCIPEVKKRIDTSQKNSNNAYETWKTSKKKAKKMNYKVPEPVSQKTKEDLEESKMAFQAWKKNKDELLKHRIAEKHRKEEKIRLDSLMNERIRKNDAESAYSAWNAHKAVVFKMEKRKNQWFLDKEKEKLQEKMQKNDEAAKVYYEWLRNKIYFSKENTHKIIRDKPPWTPPGKANSSI